MTLDTGPHLVGYFKVRLTPETSALNLRFARDPSGMPGRAKVSDRHIELQVNAAGPVSHQTIGQPRRGIW